MTEQAASLPILYSFRRCPYAMRARMALLLSGQPVRLREILLKQKPEAMLSLSPKGTVPVLALPDGNVIDESRDVMRWALALADPHNILPDTEQKKVEADQLIDTNDGPFKHHLDRYKYSTRYDPAQKVKHRDAGAAILHQLEARLAKAPFLLGQKPSLADIAIFPFVRQFRIAEPNWFDEAPISQVRRWQEGWTGCPLFAQAMEKFPIWAETGHEQLFSVGPELRPENDLMPIFHN